MINKTIYSLGLGCALIAASFTVQAATILVTEAPTTIRFEQYTGSGASMVFWRLPTPGVSTFPSSTCTALSIPPAVEVQASRFMALYLFAKTNSKNVFYQYNTTTCSIISFGIDG